MIRRRSTPWIHYWSRPLIGAIATLGILNTGYLTYEKLTGGTPTCNAGEQVKGCVDVLSSYWGTVFGLCMSVYVTICDCVGCCYMLFLVVSCYLLVVWYLLFVGCSCVCLSGCAFVCLS